MFTTDAMVGLAAVIVITVLLTYPYSIEEGSEANISFIKQEVSSKAMTAYYQGQTADDITGLEPDNSDFNKFDFAECFILYKYDFDSATIYDQDPIIEQKYCMGKMALR